MEDNHLKCVWYHHNLWMPLQCKLSQTWNIGANIKTIHFHAPEQQAMSQHMQCEW